MLGPEEMREYEEHVAHHRSEQTEAQPTTAHPRRGARNGSEAPLTRLLRAAFVYPVSARR